MVESGSPESGSISVSLKGGSVASFFEPVADRIACHAKGACQAAQTTALLVGAQNLFALLCGVTIGLWLLAAAALAVLTQVALLPIFRQAMLDDFFAAAVVAFDNLRDHTGRDYYFSPD